MTGALESLMASTLKGTCPHCRSTVALKTASLFDLNGPMPQAAINYKGELAKNLETKRKDLDNAMDRAQQQDVRSLRISKSKAVSTYINLHKDFPLHPLATTRLGSPINLFMGIRNDSRNPSLLFADVTSSKPAPTKIKKHIANAVQTGKVKGVKLDAS